MEPVRPLEAGERLVREHSVEDPIEGSGEAEESSTILMASKQQNDSIELCICIC